MSRNRKIGIAAIFTTVGLIIGLAVSSDLDFQSKAFTENPAAAKAEISQKAVETLAGVSEAMVELVDLVRPSVVNISTTRTIQRRGDLRGFFNDPFFRRFFGEEGLRHPQIPREEKRTSLGSGVIVDEGGHILTNNHVVKDAEEIKVTLFDNREFDGTVIGTDPKTDLAVIKIEAKDLRPIQWGDSDKLRVGELVVAVGSPYGLTESVTSGIVSAKGRANVRIADYEDFIQTDAAINPGNSGGPLINIRGRLVGINTAIFSTTGGYQGIGFSIPSNMARVVMESLIKEGKVIRGWLGVTIQPITPELAKQFGLKEEKGSLVSDVVEGSPAERGGLERGDIIIEYQGKRVEDPVDLRNTVAATRPGAKASVKVLRDGKEKTLSVTIGELPEDLSAIRAPGESPLAGVQVQELTDQIRQSLGISPRIEGVVVTFADEETGLLRGDVIVEINRKAVENMDGYANILASLKPGADILLLVYRNGGVFYMTIPGKKQP